MEAESLPFADSLEAPGFTEGAFAPGGRDTAVTGLTPSRDSAVAPSGIRTAENSLLDD